MLAGRALEIYRALPKAVQQDYNALTRALIDKLTTPHAVRVAALKLRQRKFQPGETVLQYVTVLKRLGRRALPNFSEEQLNEHLVENFLMGLPRHLKSPLLDKDPQNLDQAINYAQNILARRLLCEADLPYEIAGPSYRMHQSAQGKPGRQNGPMAMNYSVTYYYLRK